MLPRYSLRLSLLLSVPFLLGMLHRPFDPVVVQGKWLDELVGTRVEALRLYRYRDGGYEPGRF